MIRFATSKDKDAVLRLLDTLGKDLDNKRGFSQTNHEAIAKGGPIFEDIIASSDKKIFVYEDRGEIVGLVTFYILPSIRHGNHRGHIEDVVVDVSQRRRGIATQLMDKVKDFCKSNNIDVIKLDSGNELTEAHNFYIKNGGKQTEKMFRFDLK